MNDIPCVGVQAFRSDPLEELVIPDGTHVEEHDLVTDRDVIVGGQSTVEFGVRGGTVIAGERVEFGGHIEAEGDCRLDMWCDVADTVLVGEDAYIGERVHVGGELRVAGDLDIGDDVDIEDGFEANGWIVIRNPTPTLVFLFIYLSQLLRLGEDEKAESMLTELLEDEREAEPVVIPRNSHVSDDAWRVSAPGRIGSDCRLHGNIRAESLVVGRDNEIFGSLRAKDGITLGANSEVTGNVTTRKGTVRIGPDVTVRGDVSGEFVEVHQDADIEGAIRASEEMTMVNENVVPYPSDSPDERRGGASDGNAADANETDDADANETEDVDASTPDDVDENDTAETESGKTTGMQSD
jgi:predicted acyltransferase (DUF342 family)